MLLAMIIHVFMQMKIVNHVLKAGLFSQMMMAMGYVTLMKLQVVKILQHVTIIQQLQTMMDHVLS